MPGWLADFPLPVTTALIAATVSVLTTLLGTTLKYWYDTRHHSRKLEIEYRYEQSKKLRDHIAQSKGQLLEACDSLNHRLWNYYDREAEQWLALGGRYAGEVGYYARTFAYRLLSVFALVRHVETAALYIDATVAQPADLAFLKALKLYVRAWTQVSLFDGLPYDADHATDHFFSDHLRAMADAFWHGDAILSLKDFEACLQSRHDFEPLLRFLDGLSAGETRLRHDRVVAAHLVLLTFMNRFGYDFQKYDDKSLVAVLGRCNPAVVANLVTMIRRMELADDVEFRRLIRLTDRAHHAEVARHRITPKARGDGRP